MAKRPSRRAVGAKRPAARKTAGDRRGGTRLRAKKAGPKKAGVKKGAAVGGQSGWQIDPASYRDTLRKQQERERQNGKALFGDKPPFAVPDTDEDSLGTAEQGAPPRKKRK